MKILYIDLGTSWGGSLFSLAQLLERLDRKAFKPVVLLAERSPAIACFHNLGIQVVTIATFTVETAHTTALVGRIKGHGATSRLRGNHIFSTLWQTGRAVRDILTRTLPLTWRLLRAMKTVHPDLVHVNDAVFASRPALAAAWLARAPVVCHVRSLGHFQLWDRLLARTVWRFVFISRWVAEDQAEHGVSPSRGRLIYNGIDPALYSNAPARHVARVAMGLPADRPAVAVIGRLVPWKGQDLFLNAMRRVAEKIPGALGLVVGETEDFSRDFGPKLHELAASLGLEDVVRFTGHLSEIPTVLAALDVLVHTSVAPEPFGRVMIEAMAAGLPVAAPAEGGSLEIVLDGQTGLLYPPRDASALADAIVRLLSDGQRAREMGEAGRARVAELFTLDRCVNGMESLYRELA